METIVAFFAASRYWRDRGQLEHTVEELKAELQSFATTTQLIVDGIGADRLPATAGATLVIVPMSGAVQKDILLAARQFDSVVLYAAYIQGNAGETASRLMLTHNAAPTLMDSWSVLRKRHPRALLALNLPELKRELRTLAAFRSLKSVKLLLIGEPARKALIIGEAVSELRARTYGAYYLIRDCVVTSGSFLGAWLWSLSPRTNFIGAAVCGALGTAWFWWFVYRQGSASHAPRYSAHEP